jgi:hypothetical protein
MSEGDNVLAEAVRVFGAQEADHVVTLLEQYGQEDHERAPDRVRLAILKLCGGTMAQLQSLIRAAKDDYRDVLMWAETPEAAKITPDEVEAILTRFGESRPNSTESRDRSTKPWWKFWS